MARVSGGVKIEAELAKLAKKVPKVAARALTLAAIDVGARAVHKAPIETGHLRESGYADVNGVVVGRGTAEGGMTVTGTAPAARGDVARAVIGFNATTADGKHSYALIQHEETGFVHPKGGEAKYLEKALNEVSGDLLANLGNAIREGLLE